MPNDVPILFEDAHVVVLNKPAGVPTIPDGSRKTTDLLSFLKNKYGQKIFVLHRLDKFVTGVVIFAKTLEGYRHLRPQFSNRTIQKTYMALVHGVPQDNTVFIDKPLRRFASGLVRIDERNGEPAQTELTVEERFAAHAFVHVRPLSGRRHQIRSHLSAMGHPIAGDRRYGDKRNAILFPTLLLHSFALKFKTWNAAEMEVSAPRPEHFEKTIVKLRTLHKEGFDWGRQCPLTLTS